MPVRNRLESLSAIVGMLQYGSGYRKIVANLKTYNAHMWSEFNEDFKAMDGARVAQTMIEYASMWDQTLPMSPD